MKKLLAYMGAFAVAALALTAGLARTPVASAAGVTVDRDMLAFQSMFGVHAPFLGSAGSVGGVPGAPLPWIVHAVQGDLDKDGELTIDVDGLVLANDPSVPASLRGTNPVPFFSAVVSCTTDSGGVITTVNVTTRNFPATIPGGDAHIDQRLTLPHPCVAPIVMVTAPSGSAWFAVTGR
jgi:hypothetical protein